jgi:hypothetical protein
MVPPLHDAVKRDLLGSYTLGSGMAIVALGLLVLGRFLDRKRERGKARDDSAKAAAASLVAEESAATHAAAVADGTATAAPRRGWVWRFLNTRVLKFLGFNHLYGLPTVFWCHLASIALYSGSYFTFLGAVGRTS